MSLKDKIGTWIGYAIGGAIALAIFVGLKIVLKVGVIAWLGSLGIPTWAAIIIALVVAGFIFKGLSHFMDKNESKIDDWVDQKEAEHEEKKAEKRAAKATKKAAQE